MEFLCRVGTPEGRLLEGTFQAHDEKALREDLVKKGYHVFEVRPRGGLWRIASAGLRRPRKVPLRALLIFNQELMALLRAGLPLLQALDLMLERLRDPQFRSILSEVRDKVRSGEDLSDAVASFGDAFPPLYPATLKAGERTGELDTVIQRFIRNQRLVLDARKRVVSALIYPAVLVSLSLGLILIMAVFVVPKFEDFYAGFDAELPLLTRLTLTVSTFLRDQWILLLGGLAAGSFAFSQWRRGEAAAVTVDRWKLRVPLLGPILHRMALSEFGRSLATLLAGGIPLVNALGISVKAVSNRHVSTKVEPRIQDVREGRALHQALEDSGVFPDLAIDMVKVGEATGALESMITNVCDFFDEEVETSLQRILGLIEPVMLVVMGLIVSLLLLAVYYPMVNLLRQVQF